MAYVLGAILGAALGAALQALAVAYLVGLLVASLVVAALPTLLVAAIAKRDRASHWFRRPAAMGVVLGIAMAGALALAVKLLGGGGHVEDVHFVRPYVPAFIALPIDLVVLAILAVRGAKSGRAAVTGADLKGGSKSLGLLAARALCRAVAIVVYGAGTLFVVATLVVAFTGKGLEDSVGAFLVMDAIAAFLVGGLGTLFAWWGRAK